MAQRLRSHEEGIALLTAIIMTLIFMVVGVAYVTTIFRNQEKAAAFSKRTGGFYAAEAGINRGAGAVRNTFLTYGVPTDCTPYSLSLNGRTVTYQLSGCGQTSTVIQVPAGDPFAGLNAILYVFDLHSDAVNSQGFTEASLDLRFEARLVPMFQLAAFFKNDLEFAPGPALVINGRLHTNGDIYLNEGSCTPGMQIQGQLTTGGNLYRGRKDQLSAVTGNVWINNASGTLQILGATGPGDTSCTGTTTRLVSDSETATWGGRIQTRLRNMNLPGQENLLCAPWSCPAGQSPGSYWQAANLRIVLNATRTEQLVSGGPGPSLYALEVYGANGVLDTAKTALLKQFAQAVPGGITYSDVPTTLLCDPTLGCESSYSTYNNYATNFPQTGVSGCTANRNPRDVISSTNYCNDFRYGGFYNWRERKPILMLNIDWRKLEEWNYTQPVGSQLFNPADMTNGGLVMYTTVRGGSSGFSGTSSLVNNYGVRIYNAQRLRYGATDSGVTFVSDQAVYVMGNFNCAAPSVSVDTVPAACGANGEKPASVIGDSMNVLSCAWASGACQIAVNPGVVESPSLIYRPTDEYSTTVRPSGLPAAQQTFINAAFLAGNDATTCPGNPGGSNCGYDYYDGGLENYPRFHETWSNVKFWYQGSFVAIDTPKHTCFTYNAGLTSLDDTTLSCRTYQLNAAWLQGFWRMQLGYGYNPPLRRWFYDTNFNTAANLPPLSPRFVTLRQKFISQVFR